MRGNLKVERIRGSLPRNFSKSFGNNFTKSQIWSWVLKRSLPLQTLFSQWSGWLLGGWAAGFQSKLSAPSFNLDPWWFSDVVTITVTCPRIFSNYPCHHTTSTSTSTSNLIGVWGGLLRGGEGN